MDTGREKLFNFYYSNAMSDDDDDNGVKRNDNDIYSNNYCEHTSTSVSTVLARLSTTDCHWTRVDAAAVLASSARAKCSCLSVYCTN